jgi:hypothetical protein
MMRRDAEARAMFHVHHSPVPQDKISVTFSIGSALCAYGIAAHEGSSRAAECAVS